MHCLMCIIWWMSDYYPTQRFHCVIFISVAWAWGDPHLTTLDGHDYTFNGYGEFVMLRYGENVEFQARMRPTPGTQATQFSSFAIGTTGGGSRVEVCFLHNFRS